MKSKKLFNFISQKNKTLSLKKLAYYCLSNSKKLNILLDKIHKIEDKLETIENHLEI